MKKGDFLLIDYVGRVTETNEIFDLTNEETAKKENVRIDGQRYGPMPVIIGAGMIIKGVDTRLENMQLGKEETFTLETAEAFGPRDPKMIRIISKAQFLKQNINPIPGSFVNIDSMRAKVQAVSGGRVRVDFNDPLAGKRVTYTVTIKRVVTETSEKVKFILKRYGLEAEVAFNAQTKEAAITTKEPVKEQVQKILQNMIKEWIPEVATMKFEAKKQESKETVPEKPLEK
ncbi:MAG: peptidylprolyl isomerase [Candidatus Aenigmatarchaeota archaeon]